MSGIAGILHYHQRTASIDVGRSMAKRMSHRGPDGMFSWQSGPIAFAQCIFNTTLHALPESMPIFYKDSQFAIVADARIDNKAELTRELSLRSLSETQVEDTDILLAAYRKWGEDCPRKLIGDFAFAIWDAANRVLFCARDHQGIRPLYYYAASGFFAFASEIKALFEIPGIEKNLNTSKVADFLIAATLDHESTFYAGIRKLPPASTLRIVTSSVSQAKYWQPDLQFELQLPKENDYYEKFRFLLDTAVSCRLCTTHQVATTLSGGLDSSSITALANSHLLQQGKMHYAFSHRFPDNYRCDEGHYIAEILRQYPAIEPIQINGDESGPFQEIRSLASPPDEPYSTPQIYFFTRMFSALSARGIRVLLDGHDGDVAVSHGFGKLEELARHGQWLRFIRDLNGLHLYEKIHFCKTFKAYFLRHELNPFFQAHPEVKRLLQFFRISHTIKSQISAKSDPYEILTDHLSTAEFKERYQLWLETYSKTTGKTERQRHASALTSPFLLHAHETLNSIGSQFAIDLRHPFLDLRLLEFCLSLPSHYKLRNGFGRIILRIGLENILPHPVQWRRNKTRLSQVFLDAVLNREAKSLNSSLTNLSQFAKNLFNTSYLDGISPVEGQVSNEQFMQLWKCASLNTWLQANFT